MLSKSLWGHMTFKLRLLLPNLLLFRSANFRFGHFPRRHWSCWEAQELFLSLFFRFLLPIYFSRWVDFSQDCCERWCWYELHFFAAAAWPRNGLKNFWNLNPLWAANLKKAISKKENRARWEFVEMWEKKMETLRLT